MKFPLILISFLASLLLVQCGSPNSADNDKSCIEKIIAQDEVIGKTRNHACETISLSETIHQYVKGMDSFDYSDCPTDFKEAFEKHKEAWIAMIQVTDNYPDLRGEMHDLFDELEKGADAELFKSLLKNIWDTWGEVEKAMEG